MEEEFEFKDPDEMDYDLKSSMDVITQINEKQRIPLDNRRKIQYVKESQESPINNVIKYDYQEPVSEKFISLPKSNIYIIIGIILSIVLIYLFIKMYIRQAKMEFLLDRLITHQMMRV